MDADEARRLPFHPEFESSDENKTRWKNIWETNPYPVDEELRARITAWLKFAEFRCYYFELIGNQQAEYYQLCKFASPKDAILAKATVAETIQFYNIDSGELPNHFFSDLTDRKLMTLPVTLDGKYTIDFQELLDYQKPVFSKEMLDKIKEQYQEFQERKNPEDIALTLNSFIDAKFEEVNVPELYNPCTDKVVQSFSVNEKLLQEILQTVTAIILPLQIKQAEASSIQYSKNGSENSYMKRLDALNYSRNKIPNSILQGSIPGEDRLEVMTHPVIIDGYFMIDFARLQAFWESNENMFCFLWGGSKKGLNPFTQKPITSLVYLTALKNKTDRFIAKCSAFRFLSDDVLHHPNFLEEFTAANHYVFFAQYSQLNAARKPTNNLLQNTFNGAHRKQ